MTYSQYLQQFVGKTGTLTRIHQGGIYEFCLGDGTDKILFVGIDFIQIENRSFFGSAYDTIIPINLLVLKTA
jgi:hypothetical protein